jgi:hypothetical protein
MLCVTSHWSSNGLKVLNSNGQVISHQSNGSLASLLISPLAATTTGYTKVYHDPEHRFLSPSFSKLLLVDGESTKVWQERTPMTSTHIGAPIMKVGDCQWITINSKTSQLLSLHRPYTPPPSSVSFPYFHLLVFICL